jgi:hypothetical protein
VYVPLNVSVHIEVVMTWKDAVMASFNVLFHYLHGGSEEDGKMFQDKRMLG